MKAAFKRARPVLALLMILGWLLVFTAVAGATPNSLSPGDGARISSSVQAFSWLDNNDYGPLDHWYLEISTNPLTDSWGYFYTLPVYASPNLSSSSVNLNALGRALGPGTYYWHVLGYYGPYGSLGTAWSLPVRSFTVYNAAAPAPVIGVTPSSLTFTAAQGGANPPSQSLYVSNKGSGTLFFSYSFDAGSPWVSVAPGTATDQLYEIRVSVNIAGKTAATYNGQVDIWETGNLANYVLPPVTLQVYAPDAVAPVGTVAINGGAASLAAAAATLNVSASDVGGSGVDKMSFKDDGGAWSNWFNYAPSIPWNFSGAPGTRKVWARFKDKVGNVSAEVFDTILFAPPAPTGTVVINSGAAETNSTAVALSLISSDHSGTGIAVMRFSNDGSAWSVWEPVLSSKAWVLTAGDGVKTVYVQYKDGLGYISDSISDGITLKTVVPVVVAKLTLSAKPKAVVLGKATLLKGKLLDATGHGLVGKKVKIKAGKKVIKTVTTGVGGVYKLKVKPKKKTIYKAVFAGDAGYKAAASGGAAVTIK